MEMARKSYPSPWFCAPSVCCFIIHHLHLGCSGMDSHALVLIPTLDARGWILMPWFSSPPWMLGDGFSWPGSNPHLGMFDGDSWPCSYPHVGCLGMDSQAWSSLSSASEVRYFRTRFPYSSQQLTHLPSSPQPWLKMPSIPSVKILFWPPSFLTNKF